MVATKDLKLKAALTLVGDILLVFTLKQSQIL